MNPFAPRASATQPTVFQVAVFDFAHTDTVNDGVIGALATTTSLTPSKPSDPPTAPAPHSVPAMFVSVPCPP